MAQLRPPRHGRHAHRKRAPVVESLRRDLRAASTAPPRDRRLYWRLAQQITRERRVSPRTGRRETACELRIVVRTWTPEEGDAPLVVLAAPPPEVQS